MRAVVLICLATLAGFAEPAYRLVAPAEDRLAATAAPQPLSFFYDLYTFRESNGQTAVVAAVAVPIRQLKGERLRENMRYRFDVRLVLADTVRRTVYPSLDSVYVSLPRSTSRQHLLHTFVEIDAPPSPSMVQRVVVTDITAPGVGQLYTTPFVIPSYVGDTLMVSDIAFGLPEAVGGWTRDEVTVALLPTSQFPESSFDVFYEVYNLPNGRGYETEITITPLDDDPGQTVSTVFTGEALSDSTGTLQELRHVQSALEEGRYRMTVMVTDRETGASASRSRDVDVRGWGSGATLVPALRRGIGAAN